MNPFNWNQEVKALLAISPWPWIHDGRFGTHIGFEEEVNSRPTSIWVAHCQRKIDAAFIANSPVQRARMVVEMVEFVAGSGTWGCPLEAQIPTALKVLKVDPTDYAELVKRLEECE